MGNLGLGLGLTVARMMHWEWVGRECPYNYQIKLCGEQSAIQCNAMMIGLVLPMVKQRAGLIFILIILEIFCFCNFGCSEISIFLRLSTKKSFLAKTQRFWAQKGPLWVIGAMKRPAERPPKYLNIFGWVGGLWFLKQGYILRSREDRWWCHFKSATSCMCYI